MPPTSSTALWEVSGTAWVRLSGELDLSSAPGHRGSLLRLARSRRLVLDARDLDFVDLAGIRLIEEVVRAAEASGRQAGLVMSPTLRRLAALDGHEWLLDREHAADDLLAEIGREPPVAVAAEDGPWKSLPAMLEQQIARSWRAAPSAPTNEDLRESTLDRERVAGHLQAILGNLMLGIVVVDHEFIVRIWSGWSEELWGLRGDEVIGKNFLDLDIGLPVERLREPVRRVLAAGADEETSLEAVNRRGRAISVLVRAAPLRLDHGPQWAMIVVEDEGAG
jgi:anti-anti-sigma factor